MPRLKNAANLRRLRKKSASTRGAKPIPSSPKTPNLAKPAGPLVFQTKYGTKDRPASVTPKTTGGQNAGFYLDTGGWSSGKKPRRNGIRSWTGRYSSDG